MFTPKIYKTNIKLKSLRIIQNQKLFKSNINL